VVSSVTSATPGGLRFTAIAFVSPAVINCKLLIGGSNVRNPVTIGDRRRARPDADA
jgi:hypothetical protein